MRRRGETYKDKTDEKIVGYLKEDSRKSFVDIGKKLKLSESAVRRRVKNLVDGGVIRKFTLEMGDENVTSAIVLVSVESGKDTPDVSARLAKLGGVKTVYEITGQYDIATIMSAESITEINRGIDALRKVTGVMDTNTVIILRKMS